MQDMICLYKVTASLIPSLVMVGIGKERWGWGWGGGAELSIRINFFLLVYGRSLGALEASTYHPPQFSECVPLRWGHVLFSRVLLLLLWGPERTLHLVGAQPCYWSEVRRGLRIWTVVRGGVENASPSPRKVIP